MARGNDGRKVFLKDSDYEAFLDGLAVVRKRYPFYLYAYVLMSEPLPSALGSAASFDGAGVAVAVDRIRAAI